ncbi:MAG: peptidyl-tRNA hydrolase [Candidatus Colwellbacteria bacterium]|nr:peptidyl-tRNA hydrolase [Candidatus Colwellbacteria bacterium]
MKINPAPKLLIGLGNPDKKYENTYHNVGFLFTDYLTKNLTSPKFETLNSNTFMNTSGSFVVKELKKRGLKPEEIIIAHDDSDILLGKYKISFGRNSAGHKGIDSVIKILKTKDFWRIRIGVRKPAHLKAGDFVLKKITTTDKKTLEKVFEEIEKEISL